jgi:hypothetical protein
MDTVYRRVLKRRCCFLSPSHLKQMRSARAASLLHQNGSWLPQNDASFGGIIIAIYKSANKPMCGEGISLQRHALACLGVENIHTDKTALMCCT